MMTRTPTKPEPDQIFRSRDSEPVGHLGGQASTPCLWVWNLSGPEAIWNNRTSQAVSESGLGLIFASATLSSFSILSNFTVEMDKEALSAPHCLG